MVVLVITLILLLVSYYGVAGEHQKNIMIASYVFVGVSILLSAYIAYDVMALQDRLDKNAAAYNITQKSCDALKDNARAGNIELAQLKEYKESYEKLVVGI